MSTVPATAAPNTVAAWSNRGLHRAQLESGMWVKFAYPDLSMLTGAGKVPEHLRAVALARIARELKILIEPPEDTPAEEVDEKSIDEAKLAENTELNHWLLTQMVRAISDDGVVFTEIELISGDAEAMPSEDKLILLDLAERVRDTDARGVVMGVTPIGRFARFLHAHRKHGLCGEDCPGCGELANEARSLPAVLESL